MHQYSALIAYAIVLCTAWATEYTDILHVPEGFPIAYNGDKNEDPTCTTNNIPEWLDGFFFCQTSASYGNQSDPDGQKLIHLFDGISGVTTFDFHNGKVDAQFKYYPNSMYKIWDFYDRDMSVSKVAWDGNLFSPNDVNATMLWNKIPDPQHIKYLPNVDFWKVGNSMIAATETIEVGLTFDPQTLTNFHQYPFIDTNSPINEKEGSVFLLMPVHERYDPDGTVWNTALLAQFESRTTGVFQQHIFSVKTDGTRTFHGAITYPGSFNLSQCDQNGVYNGDTAARGSYMHSTTSTVNYMVLPMTSLLFNPCVMRPNSPSFNFDLYFDFLSTQNVRFAIFDKHSLSFAPNKIIECDRPLFPVHQFNAYEWTNTTTNESFIYADMTGFDHNVYDGAMLSRLMNTHLHDGNGTTVLMRFVINLTQGTCSYKPLISGDNRLIAEFPQINQMFQGKKYQYGYFVDKMWSQGSSIVKIDVNDPTVPWVRFTASPTVAVQEPWFVPNPGSTKEDDGVLLVKGLDANIDKSIVYVVNAQTMEQIGSATAPILVPFGLHNRYYNRDQLGMPSSTTTKPTSNPSGSSTAPAAGGSSTTPAAGGNSIPPTKGSARIGNAMTTIMSSIVVTFLLCLVMV